MLIVVKPRNLLLGTVQAATYPNLIYLCVIAPVIVHIRIQSWQIIIFVVCEINTPVIFFDMVKLNDIVVCNFCCKNWAARGARDQ